MLPGHSRPRQSSREGSRGEALRECGVQGRVESRPTGIMRIRTCRGQKPGTQEKRMPEGRANIWQKLVKWFLTFGDLCPTETLIKHFQKKQVHKQIHVELCGAGKQFTLPDTNIKYDLRISLFLFSRHS